MMYSKTLNYNQYSKVESQNNQIFDISAKGGQINKKLFKNQFKFLTDNVLSLSSSVGLNCSSAIYIIDFQKQEYVLQNKDKNIFSDTIPISNSLVIKFKDKNKKLYQKDYAEEWNEIFLSQSWRGSECALFCPIKLGEKEIGFILSMVEHVSEINIKEQEFHNELGNLISFGVSTLGTLEERIISEKNKSLILNISLPECGESIKLKIGPFNFSIGASIKSTLSNNFSLLFACVLLVALALNLSIYAFCASRSFCCFW